LNLIRVLVVDDDDRFRWQLGQFLATMPDIRVIGEAATGQEALLSATELQPDLILMDVGLPGMSGVSVTRCLCEALPQARVIVLSVYDLQEYRDAALASGASAYLIKKSMVAELMPTIQRVL
jgi:DNA-binding NarL/FixJ family response regulator